MAFGIMNTRRYVLVYLFAAVLFINCMSQYWTMWAVATFSVFILMLTDFMFFQVALARLTPPSQRAPSQPLPPPFPPAPSPRPGSPCGRAPHLPAGFRVLVAVPCCWG